VAERETCGQKCCGTTFLATSSPFCHKIGRNETRSACAGRANRLTGARSGLPEHRTCCSDLSVEDFSNPGNVKCRQQQKRTESGQRGPGGTRWSSSLRSAPTPDEARMWMSPRGERGVCSLGTCMALHGTATLSCPRQDSNLRTRLRRPVLYPLSYEGGPTQHTLAPGAWRLMPGVQAP
jgi:hypothetical protein